MKIILFIAFIVAASIMGIIVVTLSTLFLLIDIGTLISYIKHGIKHGVRISQ